MSFTDIIFLIQKDLYNENMYLKSLPNYNLIKLTSQLIQEMYNLPMFPLYQEKYMPIYKARFAQASLCVCCFPCLLFLSCPPCPIFMHYANKIKALDPQGDAMRQAFLQQVRQMGLLFQQKYPNYKFEIIEKIEIKVYVRSLQPIKIRVYHQDQDRQQLYKQENPFQIENINQQTDQQKLQIALAQPIALKGGVSDFPEQFFQPAFQNNNFNNYMQMGMGQPSMPQQMQMPQNNYSNNLNNFNGNANGIISDEQAQMQFQKQFQQF